MQPSKSHIFTNLQAIIYNIKNEAPVIAKLDTAAGNEQMKARNALVKIISSLKYMAEQGSAIRGKESSGGKFKK